MLEKIDDFIKTYRRLVVSDIIPNYIDLRAEVKKIAKSLGENTRFDGETYFERSHCSFKELEKIYDTFDLSRDSLNAKQRKEARENYFRVATLAAIVASVIIALIGVIVGID